jgi:hypothetical protein
MKKKIKEFIKLIFPELAKILFVIVLLLVISDTFTRCTSNNTTKEFEGQITALKSQIEDNNKNIAIMKKELQQKNEILLKYEDKINADKTAIEKLKKQYNTALSMAVKEGDIVITDTACEQALLACDTLQAKQEETIKHLTCAYDTCRNMNEVLITTNQKLNDNINHQNWIISDMQSELSNRPEYKPTWWQKNGAWVGLIGGLIIGGVGIALTY